MNGASVRVRNLRRHWAVDTLLLASIADTAITSLGLSMNLPSPRPSPVRRERVPAGRVREPVPGSRSWRMAAGPGPISRLDSSATRKFEVAVFLVGARRMARLNERFLRHVGPTDVVTFDYREGTHGPSLHGDIFICLDEAQRQAGLFGTTWQAEVVRYLVHGLLHLCGHDDLEPAARRRMKRVENRLVRRLRSEFGFKRLGTSVNVRS